MFGLEGSLVPEESMAAEARSAEESYWKKAEEWPGVAVISRERLKKTRAVVTAARHCPFQICHVHNGDPSFPQGLDSP